MNLAILWRLWLEAWRLILGSLRLGACSFWPLIVIRGPKRSQLLLMILSSAAMVCSWGPDACATSIVNFFIYPLLLALAHLARVKHVQFKDGPVYGLTNLSIGKPSNEIRLHPIISGTGCQAWSLGLVAFFFHNFFQAKCILVIAEAITCWGLDPRSYGVGN